MEQAVTAVVDFEIDYSGNRIPASLLQRNTEALTTATVALVNTLARMPEFKAKQIVTLPDYLIKAIRVASFSDRKRIISKLSSCVRVDWLAGQSDADRELAETFVFESYYAFYKNESPGKVEFRYGQVQGDVGIVFSGEHAKRMQLRKACERVLRCFERNDVISLMFGSGARIKTLETLLKLQGEDATTSVYNSLRREWAMYEGVRVRGGILKSAPPRVV